MGPVQRYWSLYVLVGLVLVAEGAPSLTGWYACTPSDCPPGPVWAAFDTASDCTGEVTYFYFYYFNQAEATECLGQQSPFWYQSGSGASAVFSDRVEQTIHFSAATACSAGSTAYQKEIWYFNVCARTLNQGKRNEDGSPLSPYFELNPTVSFDHPLGEPVSGIYDPLRPKRAMKTPSEMIPPTSAILPSSGVWLSNVNASVTRTDTTQHSFPGISNEQSIRNGSCVTELPQTECLEAVTNASASYWRTTKNGADSNTDCLTGAENSVAAFNLEMDRCYQSGTNGLHYQRFCAGDDAHTSGHHAYFGNACNNVMFTQIYRSSCSVDRLDTIWCNASAHATTPPPPSVDGLSHATSLSASLFLVLAIIATMFP